MPQSTADLIQQIRALQADRQRHAEALARIDQTLAQIGQMIIPSGPADAALPLDRVAVAAGKHRKYRKLPLTGEQFIVDLIRRQGSATTLEINRAWRAEGRGGVANNTIGRLLQRHEIVREALNGQRGSRYRLGPASSPPAPSSSRSK
jgi:hypothetical protein